jgi:D-alanyl-D-alanine carboxypeptidase
MRRLLLLALLPFSLAAQSATTTADSLVRDFIARGEAPAVTVAVIRGVDTVLFAGYGKADLEHDVAATSQSVFRIGSVTKQFTAAAVIQLMEQGKLRLEDSIGAHLGSLPTAWRGVTVQQLLDHTSGIPSYTDIGESWVRRWGEAMTPRQIVALVAERPMDFAPGTAWRYNNTGYTLLGMLIEKHTGKPWGDDFNTRFAEPLGLDNTLNCRSALIIPGRVRGYERFNDGWMNAVYLSMTQPYSAGALCSTIGDLTRWNQALHQGRVVSPDSYRMMTTPTGVAATAPLRYGLGLIRDTVAGHQMITHGGNINGFASANAWIPDADLSVTILANSGRAKVEALLRQLIRAAVGAPLQTVPTEVPLAAEQHQHYVGEYDLIINGQPRRFTIASAGNVLTGQLAGQQPNPLIHFGNHTFGVSFDPSVRLIFDIGSDGKATSLRLLQGGGELLGSRVQ